MQKTANPLARSAGSDATDTRVAARDVARTLAAALPVRPDLLLVFGSFHHRAMFSDALDTLRSELHPAHLLASTNETVIFDDHEAERTAGLSALALCLPGTVIEPFRFDLEDGPPSVWSHGFIAERVALPGTVSRASVPLPHRGMIMLADPFSVNASHACAAIDEAAGPGGARIHGGVASGASLPGLNVLGCDLRTSHAGIVGVSIFGDIQMDAFASQGCQPVGPCMVVTKAAGGALLELGGRPALDALADMAEGLPPSERDRLQAGLLVGVAARAGKTRLGRGDFIVRPAVDIDRTRAAIVLPEPVAVGSTVQFQARDGQIASEDLSMLLDLEQVRGPAVGALLFSCTARGSRLFAEPGHDAATLSRRLAVPIAGCRCAGEFAPIEGRSFVHNHSAVGVVFRPVAR
ncbi:MAG: FIST N-terminal domain-containing protein [Planctomycetota bacterium]